MKTKHMLLITMAFFTKSVFSQNTFPATGSAGIGTTSPNASSALDITSTTQGLLAPRMTAAQRNAIASPATGLLIFQTNSTPGFYYYNGTTWTPVSPNNKGWQLTGNSGIDPTTNFIGTTDVQPLLFRVDNLQSGVIDASSQNAGFGYQSLKANTSGQYNSAFGTLALTSNTTGSGNTALGIGSLDKNTNGYYNTAVGNVALYSNKSGHDNVAVGTYALWLNKTGNGNSAVGDSALKNNTGGLYNAALGHSALAANTTGSYNNSIGYKSLFSNTTGSDNNAMGIFALWSNTTGSSNTAIGDESLDQDSSGSGNTAFGAVSLSYVVGEDDNTAVGYGSGGVYTSTNSTYLGAMAAPTTNWSVNSTAVGYEANVSASNQVRLGNSSVTSIGGYANWTNISDGRYKKNIKENIPGLAFINKLRPVSYNLDIHGIEKFLHPDDKRFDKMSTDAAAKSKAADEKAMAEKEKIVYTGFVAQEVEKSAKELNYDFSGVDAPKDGHSLYGLRYSEFVVPLVKAVQELSQKNDDLQKQIDDLKTLVQQLSQNSAIAQNKSNASSVALTNASLGQNMPNPFTATTVINYVLPQKFTEAEMIVSDNNGNALKRVNLSGAGAGTLKVDAITLSGGTYRYSLYIDGKLIGSKQMVVAK
jgi:hypothetical protein